MGNRSTKSSLRNAIVHLNICAEPVALDDDKFWAQIWNEDLVAAAEVIREISAQEIRMLRDGAPRNFAALTYKMVERLCLATGTLCNTQSQQTAVLNSTRVLIRLIPCILEDKQWRDYFAANHLRAADESRDQPDLVFPQKLSENRNYRAYLPSGCTTNVPDNDDDDEVVQRLTQVDLLQGDDLGSSEDPPNDLGSRSLARLLIMSICDLLFCPEFTVTPHADGYLSNVIDAPPEDLKSLATCDYVWEPGVGFESSVNSTTYYDQNRSELLRLLLTSLSVSLYEKPENSIKERNYWIEAFASNDNRHALPLFTSLLNTVLSYKPSKPLLSPLNHLLFRDSREELVELAIQVLIVTLDYRFPGENFDGHGGKDSRQNLFIEYMSRVHRGEDFVFIVKGLVGLLNVRLDQGYLSSKRINFDQELLILFWKLCNLNRKFISFLLLADDEILDIVVPILYHLNENFQDPSKTALIHVGVFNLLILSSERNFGVKLNRAYQSNVLANLPNFAGSHADLMIIVFHKLILYGQNLNQLFVYLTTIMANTSPYLKNLSTLASKCLMQLFEVFSSPFVIFTEPNYHQLVVLLLEIFNNLIQYQFDGNAKLVCVLAHKKGSFMELANLPATKPAIDKVLAKLAKRRRRQRQLTGEPEQEPANCERPKRSPTSREEPDGGKSPLGATVSSDPHLASRPQPAKQEVSLVATPDIRQVIQPVRPFQAPDCRAASSRPDSSPAPGASIMDDILADTVAAAESSSGPPPPTSAPVEGREAQPEAAARRWRPTPEWARQYKQSLPLQSILRMIEALGPQLEQFKGSDEPALVRFLQSSTLVGLLPVPHPILIRKYQNNEGTTLWFRACTWGLVYVRNCMWTDTSVRLIRVV